jgi:hypothetical protein
MAEVLFCLFCLAVPIAVSWFCLKDSMSFTLTLTAFLCGLACLLWVMNFYLPFSKGGDDNGYFLSSCVEFDTLHDWFNLQQFSKTYAQPGYPLLNAWVHQFTGKSLLSRKFLNLSLFGLLAVWWAYTGQRLGGRKLSFAFGLSILLATPLWYYIFFLLKDMTITVLESLIIGSIMIYLSSRTLLQTSLISAASCFLLIPLRLPLVAFNFLALFASIISYYISAFGLGSKGRLLVLLFGALAFFAVNAGTQSEVVELLGISSENQIDYSRYQQRIDTMSSERKISKVAFPILYLIGEANAFNPKTWRGAIDSEAVRGLLWLPWTLLGLPLFFLGCVFIARGYWQRFPILSNTYDFSQNPEHRNFANGYRVAVNPAVIFIIAFAALSWVIGDTTRYRIASIPPLFIIAATGYLWFPSSARFKVSLIWLVLTSTFIVIYYSRR